MLELVPESIVRVLIAASVFLFLLGLCFITKRERPAPRNVRRESGNTVPRRPNVRRPLAPSCDCDAEARNAEIRALIAFPLREPCWADDEVTKVGGAA